MNSLPTADFFGHAVSRLICGGNPFSGFSHVSAELDREMIELLKNVEFLLQFVCLEFRTADQIIKFFEFRVYI